MSNQQPQNQFVKPGDMAVVIYIEGAEYANEAPPGTVGTCVTFCNCMAAKLKKEKSDSFFVGFKTAKGDSICIVHKLLKRIDPPGKEVGSLDEISKLTDWRPGQVTPKIKETEDA